MSINTSIFKQLGFSGNDIAVYMALHSLKRARASAIMKETKMQRSVVYPSLEELVARRLVSKTITRGVATFSFNDPESLVRETLEKAKMAEGLAEQLKSDAKISPRESFVYEGMDCIIKVANQTLQMENGETVYFLGPSKYGSQANLERYWSTYHITRIKKGIKCKILYDKHTPAEIVEDRNAQPLCEAKYMPFGFDLPVWVAIYGDVVAMVVPGEEPPLAFIVRSAKTAEGFIQYFNFLWNASKKNYFDSI